MNTSADHEIKTGSLSFELTRCTLSGSHAMATRIMETPGSRRLKQSFGCGARNLCCTLSVYYVAAEYATNMVCPNDEISWFINRITNICSHFGLIWKHTGVICRTVNSIPWKIYICLVEDNFYWESNRTMETDRFFRFGPVRTPSDRCEPWKASE